MKTGEIGIGPRWLRFTVGWWRPGAMFTVTLGRLYVEWYALLNLDEAEDMYDPDDPPVELTWGDGVCECDACREYRGKYLNDEEYTEEDMEEFHQDYLREDEEDDPPVQQKHIEGQDLNPKAWWRRADGSVVGIEDYN